MAVPYSSVPALRIVFRRGVAIATLARLAVMVVMMFAPRAQLRLAPVSSLAFIGICGGLMLLDAARRHELVFFMNLGIRRWHFALCGAIPALLIETTLALVA